MSYPYQQGPPQSMPGMPPYPQQRSQPSYPPGQAPYPQNNSQYPQSFDQPSPYQQPSQYGTGFGFNAPAYMPMPQPMGQNAPSMPQAPPSMPQYPSSMPQAPPSMPQYPSSMPQYPPIGETSPSMPQYPPSMGQTPPYMSQGPPSMGYATSSISQTQLSMGNSSPYGQFPSYGAPNAPPAGAMPSSAPIYHEHKTQTSHYGSLGSAAPTHGHSTQQSYKKKYSPTVLPAEPFNPRADAETLRKAMKGFGTDEKAIIQVLANRTNAQRLEIAVQFKTLYGKDVIKDLKSELSGRLEDLVVALMTPLPQFYAKEVHEALSGVGTDEDTLIEVFCTMNNNEIRTIRAAYEMMYHSSLESDLSGDTSGTFRRLMVSLCTANRDESMMINPEGVSCDAQALLRAGELQLGTDESTFNAILCQRNFEHLRAVFEDYQRVTGHDIEKAIKNEFSGDAEEGMLALVRSIKDRAQFFARRLHQSMKGMGTNDQQLIRLVVTRCEVDMGDIKNAYQAKYGKSLHDDISSDCSGDYKKCLLALINL